ncbi:unnamed protein product [Vitrella brassicaformis CCMP3155]|uniref:PA14 domain-containing protein n=1 Tax=Vitrella brassicaformis (strain CCMP3155) TaxID=1169540 RepID=A0A0G4GQH7_VITBC|nr:unnamed protein product [Vitrella brassicaformis CCMP3155]|eukprot:CEM32701.1 unnamed protein product [Vitrella brassicaformis CCMP3155]
MSSLLLSVLVSLLVTESLEQAPPITDVGYDREPLAALTRYRQQHRKTIDGRLCAAAFAQDGLTYTDCTDATNPDGATGREWCYYERVVKGRPDGWNYCVPVVDYDAVRSSASEAFTELTSQARVVLDRLNHESGRLMKEEAIYETVCGAEHEAVGAQISKVESLLDKGNHCIAGVEANINKIQTIKSAISTLEMERQKEEESMELNSKNCEGLPGYEESPFADGLRAVYFSGATFSGDAKYRDDPNVDFEFFHKTPIEGVPISAFSARWDGYVLAPQTGYYHFTTIASGGCRLFLSQDAVIVDRMPPPPSPQLTDEPVPLLGPQPGKDETRKATSEKPIKLVGGQKYKIRLEFFHSSHMRWNKPYDATIKLLWSIEGVMSERVVPPSALFKTNPPPALKLSGFDPSTWQLGYAANGEAAFMADSTTVLADLPLKYVNMRMLRTNATPAVGTKLTMTTNMPAKLFVLSQTGESLPVASCEERPLHFHATDDLLHLLSRGPRRTEADRAVGSRILGVHYVDSPAGDVGLAVTHSRPFVLLFDQPQPKGEEACGGETVVLSRPNSDTYAGCEASSQAGDDFSFQYGLSGRHTDGPLGVWRSSVGAGGVYESITVKFSKPVQINEFKFKPLDSFVNRPSEIRLTTTDEPDETGQVFSIRSSNSVRDYRLPRPIVTRRVTATVTAMSGHGQFTGGSFDFIGTPCSPETAASGNAPTHVHHIDCTTTLEKIPEVHPVEEGSVYAFSCPPVSECLAARKGSVYGDGLYAAESNLCKAAIHSGACGVTSSSGHCDFYVTIVGPQPKGFSKGVSRRGVSSLRGPSGYALAFQSLTPPPSFQPAAGMQVDVRVANGTWAAAEIAAVSTLPNQQKEILVKLTQSGAVLKYEWPSAAPSCVLPCGSRVPGRACIKTAQQKGAISFAFSFQPSGVPTPAGFIADNGQERSTKAEVGTPVFGWTRDAHRNIVHCPHKSAAATDPLNSYGISFPPAPETQECREQRVDCTPNSWTVAGLPTGRYLVQAQIGSPCATLAPQHTHKEGTTKQSFDLQVNGVSFVKHKKLAAGQIYWASGEVTVDDKSISVTAECMASGASRESVCARSHTTLMALTIQRIAQPIPDSDDP